MSDENWPAPTPRDEMLARVATRGIRIRAVRGAVNALVILSVVGASALGIGAVVDGLGDGGGTEMENIAVGPEPPEAEVGSTEPTQTSGDTDVTNTTGSTGTTISDPGDTGVPGTTTSNGGTGATDDAGVPVTGGRGSSTTTTTAAERPSTSGGGTTSQPPTTIEPVTTTTQVPAPVVGVMRTKVDGGISTGLSLCDDPSAVLAVSIEGADSAVLTWNRAGQTRHAEMTAGAFEWSAPIPEIDQKAADVPVVVTVSATGPGGTTRTSAAIPVADCTPLPSVPSAQRS